MFNEKGDLIGLLLLIGCLGSAGVLIWQIETGNRLRYTGPQWLIWILAALFLGTTLYGLFSAARRWRDGDNTGPQWPSPESGRKSLWDRLRGR